MIERNRAQVLKAELLLITVAIIWAGNIPLLKWGIAGLDFYILNGIRFAVASIFLATIYFSRSQWTPIARRDWPKLVGTGIVANVLYQIVFIIGLTMTTAGNSAVLLSTAPLWTVSLSGLIHKEKIRRSTWIGMAISLSGVIMVIIGSGKKLEFGSDALFGDLIMLVAAALWGLNTNLQKPLLTRYSPLQLALIMVVTGAVGLSLIAIPSAVTSDWGSVHWTYYLAAIVSGALSIAIANVFWSFGVKHLGPGRTANFGNLVPVLALLIAYVSLNEQPFLIQLIGAAVTIGGVWLARR